MGYCAADVQVSTGTPVLQRSSCLNISRDLHLSPPPSTAGGGATLAAPALLRHRAAAGGEHAPAVGGAPPAG